MPKRVEYFGLAAPLPPDYLPSIRHLSFARQNITRKPISRVSSTPTVTTMPPSRPQCPLRNQPPVPTTLSLTLADPAPVAPRPPGDGVGHDGPPEHLPPPAPTCSAVETTALLR